jgi:hypothetical protein
MTDTVTESDWPGLIDEDAGLTVTVGVILFWGGDTNLLPPQAVTHRQLAESSPATARHPMVFIYITSARRTGKSYLKN